MASLSNINGIFDVHSTGAIQFNGNHGTAGQILKSNGNAAPTWVDASTVIGGPYLPLSGGTLTGATATASGISFSVGGALSAGVTTITSDTGLIVYSSTNAVGANITFSDVVNRTQSGSISYFHQDTASYGSANAFVITSDQSTMTILADGKLMYNEGVYLKPATGTGGGSRKDNLWDAAYNDKITGLAVTGTTTKTLTATQQDGGTLTATWTDNDGGGTVTGTGADTQVAFWTGTSVIDGSSDLRWDNTNKELGIGRNPDYPLDVYKSSSTSGTATGTTVQRLWNYVGGDLSQQKTFIDFVFQDDNDNQYPQVRIGAEVGQNGDANSTIKEGSGAFVVYTNNADNSTPGTNVLAERMRVDYAGNVGIGTTSPTNILSVHQSDASSNAYVHITHADGGSAATDGLSIGLEANGVDAAIRNRENGYLRMFTNNTERMRIGSNGYVGMGIDNTNNQRITLAEADSNGSHIKMNNSRAGGGYWVNGVGDNGSNASIVSPGGIFWYNGTTRMVINSAGNVGIGTSSPGNTLHVYKNATIGAITAPTVANAGFRVQDSGANMYVDGNSFVIDNSGYLTTTGSNDFDIGTNSTSRIKIKGGGDVGIGETNPNAKLDIKQEMKAGTTAAFTDPHLRLSANNTVDNTGFVGMTFATSSANNYGFSWGAVRTTSALGGMHLRYHNNSASGTDIFNIDYVGNVTIGTQTWTTYGNNPIGKLNIEVAGGDALNIYNTSENNANLRFIDSQSNGTQYAYLAFNSSNNYFFINNMGQNAITINSSGYVGINNTSPQTTLHTGPTTTITNVFTARFAASNFFASGGNSMFYVPDTAANIMMFGSNQLGTNQIEFYHKNPGTSQSYVGRISTSGSATSYVTSSDYRLKENIIPISDSISRLNQLKPSRFNFIEEPNKTVDGFIAHEVQNIVPEAIVGKKDAVNEDGSIIPQGIDQAKLVPLLVAAVQELEARVKELENK